MIRISEKMDVPEIKDAELPKEVEEERDIHGDDGEQSKPAAEKVKKETEDAAKKELNNKENLVNDINDADTPKPLANNGSGKNTKIKGLTEKISLKEPSGLINEGLEEEGGHDKVDILLDDFGVDPRDLLLHIVNLLPYDELNDLVNDFIEENDLGDEMDFISESPEDAGFLGQEIDEDIPNDLARAYKRFDYKGNNADTDLYNSEYIELTPEEAKKAYKEDPTSIKLLFGKDWKGRPKMIDFMSNGKPSLKHRDDHVYDPDKVYTRSSGKVIRDTRRMPISHLLAKADKIYLVKEVEKNQDLINKRRDNIESKYNNNKHITSDSISGLYTLRGGGSPGDGSYSFNSNKDNLKRWKEKLIKLEKDAADGLYNGPEQAYNREKENILDQIKYYENKYQSSLGNKNDIAARRRYYDSEKKMREPFNKYKEIKNGLNDISSEVEYAKDSVESIKSGGSQKTREYRKKLEDSIKKLEIIKRDIALCEIALENADEDDAEELARVEKNYEKVINKNNELQAELNKLLRR